MHGRFTTVAVARFRWQVGAVIAMITARFTRSPREHLVAL